MARQREPYATTSALRRFSQRYTTFSRAAWDESFALYGDGDKAAREPSAAGRPGHGRQDTALESGAWAVARSQLGSAAKPSDPADPATRAVVEQSEPGDALEPTRRLKDAARLYGADLVGIARVNPLWIYASDGENRPVELPEGLHTAVVIAVEMDYDKIKTSPSAVAGAATGNGYSRMAFTGNCLARYLTDLGWRALYAGNDTGLSVPLAIDAGLGEAGRNGLLITPQYGPRVRLCKVFTDAPLIPDGPIAFGVKEFCGICMKCATTCPSRSISLDDMTDSGPTVSNNPGVLKWYTNPETCLAFWRQNGTSCANCIRSCPFNKARGRLHDLARGTIRARWHWLDRLLVVLDDLCGYGTTRAARRALSRYAAEGDAKSGQEAHTRGGSDP